eukprot:Phypoly_transcript_02007.p1 GENE.Phypoly_transcript_02007~~Phypoly_transcript_02007.p1  ORF type:complete len:680 (+),score=119.58 Phypoly_transcript_02007:94-2040(+)
MADMKQLISFLEDNVMRLNVELSRYQAKYPPLLPSDGPSAALSFKIGDPTPPWLIDSQHLSPLLASYDMRIGELEAELNEARAQAERAAARVKWLSDGNNRLHCQDAIQPHAQQPYPDDKRGNERAHDDADVREREKLLKEENDVLLEQHLLAQQELTSIRNQLNAATAANRDREAALMQASVANAKQTTLEREKSDLELQLMRKREELAIQSSAAANYKKSLDEMTIQKDILVKDNTELLAREKVLISVNTTLDQDVKNLRDYQRQLEHERESLVKERDDLFHQLVTLERRFSDCEQREHNAVQGLQQAITAAEEANLQREQAEFKEHRASKHVSHLTGRITSLPAELRAQFAKEIEEMQTQHKAQISSERESMAAIITEQGDLKALLDRAIRDKRAMENEITRLQREPQQEMERYQGEICRSQALALALQNERDALAAQLEGLATSEISARRALEKERTQAVLQTEEAVRKVKRLETDLIIATESQHKLKQQLEQLHKANQELAVSKGAQIHELTQELSRLMKEHELELRALTIQLEESNEAYYKAEQMQKGLIDEQHKMRERWRDETKTSSLRFEHILQEQKAETEQLRTRADDLATRLASTLADNEQLAREHQDTFHILKHLRSQISLAELHLNEGDCGHSIHK